MNKVSRDLLDGGLLIISSTLKETPRTAIIFLAIVILLGLMIGLVILFLDIIVMNRLLPILGDGVMPVVHSVLKQNYQFPFAEVICFKMIMPLPRRNFRTRTSRSINTTAIIRSIRENNVYFQLMIKVFHGRPTQTSIMMCKYSLEPEIAVALRIFFVS
ncbi:hypothetical protein D3C80_1291890 [compost metagenome]